MTELVFIRSRYRADLSILDDLVTYIHQLHPNPAKKSLYTSVRCETKQRIAGPTASGIEATSLMPQSLQNSI